MSSEHLNRWATVCWAEITKNIIKHPWPKGKSFFRVWHIKHSICQVAFIVREEILCVTSNMIFCTIFEKLRYMVKSFRLLLFTRNKEQATNGS